MLRYEFPDHFLWGASTSSYQVEGGIEHTDWAHAAGEGRVPPTGRACDHYHRFEEDVTIAHSLGHNAHRFSIEWARVEPKEGEFDEEAIEHYRSVLRALRKRNIEPMITLWHVTLPLWFSESGGFLSPDAPDMFARYCAYMVDKLGDLCTHFYTMHEPTMYATQSYREGQWPPFERSFLKCMRVERALTRSHRAAYRAIKNVHNGFVVGLAMQILVFDGATMLRRIQAHILNWNWNHRFLRAVQDTTDTIGVNYYTYIPLGIPQTKKVSDVGGGIHPERLYDALMQVTRYDKPIMVTEAGCADQADAFRGAYIQTSVSAVHRAITEGVDVRGFMYASLLDRYEWANGYSIRVGLVAVDFDTLERTVRPSALVYKEICEENALLEK